VAEAARTLYTRIRLRPEIVLVLGSGLGALARRVESPVSVAFDELPDFPPTSVSGHAGRWVAGRLGGRAVLVQEGRYHAYEGWGDAVVAAPVRVAAALGVRSMLMVSAAGGVDPVLGPGELVLLDDHLNLGWRHPLGGPVPEGEQRFPDMSAPYDPRLQRTALAAAARLGIGLHRGVYAGVSGPSYETAAEVRMLRRLGADVIGMSTVPEVIVARARGVRCLAIAVVTNKATGLAPSSLSHDEVVATARAAADRVERLLVAVLEALPGSGPVQSSEAK